MEDFNLMVRKSELRGPISTLANSIKRRLFLLSSSIPDNRRLFRLIVGDSRQSWDTRLLLILFYTFRPNSSRLVRCLTALVDEFERNLAESRPITTHAE